MTHNPYTAPKSMQLEPEQLGDLPYPTKRVVLSINIALALIVFVLLLMLEFDDLFDDIFISIIAIIFVDFLTIFLPNLLTCLWIIRKEYHKTFKNIIKVFFVCTFCAFVNFLLLFYFLDFVDGNTSHSIIEYAMAQLGMILIATVIYAFIFLFVAVFSLPTTFQE